MKYLCLVLCLFVLGCEPVVPKTEAERLQEANQRVQRTANKLNQQLEMMNACKNNGGLKDIKEEMEHYGKSYRLAGHTVICKDDMSKTFKLIED